jgi:hypothetical protein
LGGLCRNGSDGPPGHSAGGRRPHGKLQLSSVSLQVDSQEWSDPGGVQLLCTDMSKAGLPGSRGAPWLPP